MQTDVRIGLRNLLNEVKDVYYIETERYDKDQHRWVESSGHLTNLKFAREKLLEIIGEAFLNGLI